MRRHDQHECRQDVPDGSTHEPDHRAPRSKRIVAVIPGLFNNLFMTRRGGGVILQTASQHAFSSAKICKFSQKISNISPRFCKIQRILTIICVLPQFRQNSMKIAAKMTDLNENSTKISQNHEKIAKINGAKDCKFEFGAVQRNANLVDLENPCKMRLFSLS